MVRKNVCKYNYVLSFVLRLVCLSDLVCAVAYMFPTTHMNIIVQVENLFTPWISWFVTWYSTVFPFEGGHPAPPITL